MSSGLDSRLKVSIFAAGPSYITLYMIAVIVGQAATWTVIVQIVELSRACDLRTLATLPSLQSADITYAFGVDILELISHYIFRRDERVTSRRQTTQD